MAYANLMCSKCGDRLPANELTSVTDNVFTGSTQYQTRVRGTLRPGGRADHYARRRSRLCPRCLTKRRLGQLAVGSVAAYLFAPSLAVLLIGAGIVVFLLFALRRWLGLLSVGLAIAAGAFWIVGGHPLGVIRDAGISISHLTLPTIAVKTPRSTPVSPTASAITDEGAAPSGTARDPTDRPASSPPIAQPTPTARASYPACSATITDHCVER